MSRNLYLDSLSTYSRSDGLDTAHATESKERPADVVGAVTQLSTWREYPKTHSHDEWKPKLYHPS